MYRGHATEICTRRAKVLLWYDSTTQIKVLDHIIIGENRCFSFGDIRLSEECKSDFLASKAENGLSQGGIEAICRVQGGWSLWGHSTWFAGSLMGVASAK